MKTSLYKIDSKGKSRIWTIQQLDPTYRVASGILDGKMFETDWTACFPKNVGKSNEKSATEQCMSEVQSINEDGLGFWSGVSGSM